jgi:hypothetical protein
MEMHMRRRLIAGVTVLLLAIAPAIAWADGADCNDPEEKQAAAKIKDQLARAEKSGQPDQLYVAYTNVKDNGYCLPDALQAKARAANFSKLGRDAAAKAEAAGLFYNGEMARGGGGKASAFAWFEEIKAFADADRVMLKAVRAKPDDYGLFKTAWDLGGRERPTDGKPYKSPAGYRQELEKSAAAAADRVMKAEEKDAAALSGSAMAVGVATGSSLKKLETAAAWMKFTPGGDKAARARAEQRGDAIMKRSDPMATQGYAVEYYKFSGSAKAMEAAKQVEARQAEFERGAQKAGKNVEAAITQKSAAEQKKFDKGKASLEKELGF